MKTETSYCADICRGRLIQNVALSKTQYVCLAAIRAGNFNGSEELTADIIHFVRNAEMIAKGECGKERGS